MPKSRGGGPAQTGRQARANRLIARRRAEVEGVFATLERGYGCTRVRDRGLARNTSHLPVLGLAYDMKRVLKLA